MAEEWALGMVQAINVCAMRKQIYKHSQAHQSALEIEAQKEKEILPTLTEKVNDALDRETANSLRTAYCTIKERLAFSKMSRLNMLQEIEEKWALHTDQIILVSP